MDVRRVLYNLCGISTKMLSIELKEKGTEPSSEVLHVAFEVSLYREMVNGTS